MEFEKLFDENDECKSMESYVVLDSAQQMHPAAESPEASAAEAGLLTHTEGTVAQRLRSAASMADLIAVLNEIWRPDVQVVEETTEEISSRRGIICGVNAEDFLFDIEADLKKLLALIVYRRTGFAAKTAAVDVLTWLSSLDVVLDNPALSKDDICKWIIQLSASDDAATASTGLRGLRNLISVEQFRDIIEGQENFVDILDYLKPGHQVPKHADVYIFDMYYTLLNEKGRAPAEAAFFHGLTKSMANSTLSVEARRWAVQCMDRCICLADDVNALIQVLISRGDVISWLLLSQDGVFNDTMDLVMMFVGQLPSMELELLLGNICSAPDVMAKLFDSLSSGLTDLETLVLTLLSKTAKHVPKTFYHCQLDSNWFRLQPVLEHGSEENKALALQLLHEIAKSAGPEVKDIPLPLPESGYRFVELLVDDLNSQTFDILHFMWTHYQDVLPALLGIELPSAILCWFMETGWHLEAADILKVREFLGMLLMESADMSAQLKQAVMTFFRSCLITENEAYIRRCLPLSMEFLAKIGSRGDLIQQLMGDLVPGFLSLMKSDCCLGAIEDPADLFCVLKAVMEFLCNSIDPPQYTDELCVLFMYTINSAEVFGIGKVVDIMMQLSQPKTPYVMAVIDLPGKLTQSGLNHRGLAVLETLLHQWAHQDLPIEEIGIERFNFLESLLRLLFVSLKTSEKEIIEVTTMLQSLVHIMAKVQSAAAPMSTHQCLLAVLTVESERVQSEIVSWILKHQPQVVDGLWNIAIQLYGSDILSVPEWQSVMLLLKSVSKARTSDRMDEQLTNLIRSNSELMSENAAKTMMIAELESAEQDLAQTVQDLSLQLHNSQGACSSQVDQETAPTVVKLDARVKRLIRDVGEKESRIVTLTDHNEQLINEVQDRKQAEKGYVDLIDNQYQRIALLENILKAEGYQVEDFVWPTD